MTETKKVLLDILKKLHIIDEKDTGNVTIHLNDGNVSKVTKQVEIK